jgi:hypothetical protein
VGQREDRTNRGRKEDKREMKKREERARVKEIGTKERNKEGNRKNKEGMQTAAFWVVTPCSLVEFTDVSEVLAASILILAAVRTSNPNKEGIQTPSDDTLLVGT